MRKAETISKLIALATRLIAVLTIIYTELYDFLKIQSSFFFATMLVFLVFVVLSYFGSKATRKRNAIIALIVGTVFYFGKLLILFVAAYGIFLVSPQSIWVLYVPFILFIVMLIYPVYFEDTKAPTVPSKRKVD